MSLKIRSISPSRIKTFDSCKFKYWLNYHEPDVQLKTNWGAVHGSLVHDVLENFSNGDDTDWTDRLYRGYSGRLETLDRYQEPEIMESPLVWAKEKDYALKKPMCDTCPHTDLENNRCNISYEPLDDLPGCPKTLFEGSIDMTQEVIERYQDVWDKILLDPQGVPVGCEYGFKILVPGTQTPMIGYMDLAIERDKDTVEIIDYKTGTWTQNYEECRDDIQVRMYSLAGRREFIDDVNNKGYKYKNVFVTFDYFTKNPVTLAFTAEEDMETEVYVRNKIEEIQSTNFIERIVRSNDDFSQRWAWKCRSLCDTEVCASQWKGKFEV